jgi:hypothetical protein
MRTEAINRRPDRLIIGADVTRFGSRGKVLEAMIHDEPHADDHPIVARAVGLLEVEDHRYVLKDRGLAELCRELDAIGASWELPLAVDALLRLAHVLEAEWSSPAAADAVCWVIERDPVLNALKALAQEARESVEGAPDPADAEEFQKFTGAAAKKAAAKLGENPPEGAVRLDAFKAPRRV